MRFFSKKPEPVASKSNNAQTKTNTFNTNYYRLTKNYEKEVKNAIIKKYIVKLGPHKVEGYDTPILVKRPIESIKNITPQSYKNIIKHTFRFHDRPYKEGVYNFIMLLGNINKEKARERNNKKKKAEHNSFIGPKNINRNSLTNRQKSILRALYGSNNSFNGINLIVPRRNAKTVENISYARREQPNRTGTNLYYAYRKKAIELAK
jgi:hypothetical protein